MEVDPVRSRRLEEVYQAALGRPPHERAAFLREACGDDEALRVEIDALLEGASRAATAITYSPGGTPLVDGSRDLVGRRIGPYELLAKVGAGGMGVVYRAHDSDLGRTVAIKVLPEAFAADPERLARFEREARLLASMNHPHIAAIHGLQRSGDATALVLEFIDGQTLEARLTRGPIAVAQALEFGVQIASALDHAHRRGVAHRDLKPANIMLTPHGVKLLDFGLAKWSQRPAGYAPAAGGEPLVRPTGAPTLTLEGTILGTVSYMAPEQVEGKNVDARADLFAFGAVLFEMLVGRKAFDGGSAAAVIAAVLNSEPPGLDTAQPLAPRSLDRLVRKCLAKDPDERWQSAHDLADELKWIAAEAVRSTTSGVQAPQAGLTPVDRRSKWAPAAAVIACAAAIAWLGWGAWPRREAAPSLITRFTVQPTTVANLNGFAVSPDGREIAYTGTRELTQQPQLYVRRLDQIEDVPVAGTEDARDPFYSPDGQWIGFFSRTRLMKVQPHSGTAPVTLCECVDRSNDNGAAWLVDGSVAFTRPDRGLQRVSAEGGEPSELTTLLPAAKELDHHAPSPLPGGRALLFTSHAATGKFDVEVVRLDTGDRKAVVKSAYDARYLPSGHLVYARRGAILAAPFNLDRLETTGPEVTLVEGVADRRDSGYGAYTVSLNGTLLYRALPSVEGRALAWVTRGGLEIPVPLTPRAFSSPRVSPDGSRLAFAVEDSGRRDIWTYELGTQKLARLTREGDNKVPAWSRDGRRLAYSSTRDGTPKIWVQPADGSGPPEAIATGADVIVPASWTPGDRSIVYVHADTSATGTRTAVVAISGDRRPQQLFPDETRGPAVSPDGRWIAFTAAESAANQVYVTAFPNGDVRRQVSVAGGRQPLWRRDGRELVYRSGTRVFSVAVDLAGGFQSAAPVLLFERSYVVGLDVMGFDYDLAPDGRFLMIKPSPAELRSNSLNVVVNWIDELTRRVPIG